MSAVALGAYQLPDPVVPCVVSVKITEGAPTTSSSKIARFVSPLGFNSSYALP